MKNDIGLFVLMALGLLSLPYYGTVYHFGEMYGWGKEHYSVFGSLYGFLIGCALAYHWTINYLKK